MPVLVADIHVFLSAAGAGFLRRKRDVDRRDTRGDDGAA
jgi:hypothetical protein